MVTPALNFSGPCSVGRRAGPGLRVTVIPMAEPYLPEDEGGKAQASRRRLLLWLAPESTGPTWAGLATAGIGFALLAFGWGRVAGLTNVALQVPYVISAGFTGLGLIAVGCTVLAVQARRQDAAARDKRLAELEEVLTVLEKLASGSSASGSAGRVDDEEPEVEPPPRRSPRRAPAGRSGSTTRRPRKAAAR